MVVDLNMSVKNGVFLFQGSKKILIIATKNIINYLLSVTSGINNNIRSIDPDFIKDFKEGNVTFLRLEESGFRDNISLNLRLRCWYDKYKADGCLFYSHQKLGTNYSIVTRILNRRGYKAFVMLKPGRHNITSKFITVGVFKTIPEAKEWISVHYPCTENVYTLIWAYNETTKDMLCRG